MCNVLCVVQVFKWKLFFFQHFALVYVSYDMGILNIKGERVPHTFVNIIGEEACYCHVLSHVMYCNHLLLREVLEMFDHVEEY